MQCGWLGGRPIKKFQTTWVIVRPKPGSIYVTRHLPVTVPPIIMDHSIGLISHQSFLTPQKAPLFQTTELYSFNTCRRHHRSNAMQLVSSIRRCHERAVQSTVWLANLLADMIPSMYEASVFPWCIHTRGRYRHPDSDQLFNAANANF